jgi:hypothetical protein
MLLSLFGGAVNAITRAARCSVAHQSAGPEDPPAVAGERAAAWLPCTAISDMAAMVRKGVSIVVRENAEDGTRPRCLLDVGRTGQMWGKRAMMKHQTLHCLCQAMTTTLKKAGATNPHPQHPSRLTSYEAHSAVL